MAAKADVSLGIRGVLGGARTVASETPKPRTMRVDCTDYSV
jgi:hypothetical protein